ncbi:MAG: carbamoyltransferase HypF [Caldilineaceae bacterium]|nr:carbamoyltransferase HypF [Caldilineaceae bacterium]
MDRQQSSAEPTTIERRRLRVSGVVQGVGFRPFVYNLAVELGLAGFVGNNSQGVFIEVEGASQQLEQFLHNLEARKPPLAHIDAVEQEPVPLRNEGSFTIVASSAQPGATTLVSPDLCTCDDCLRELMDPHDRRHHYPFINCTNCGPRFTIIRDLPYDRPATTMASFAMCPDCRQEYSDPGNRRFHAQPNACPVCGPQVTFRWSTTAHASALATATDLHGSILERQAAIAATQRVLAAEGIVAVKGLGGYHLACDATSASALRMLRERKGRVDKPFAIMAASMDAVAAVATPTAEEVALLTARERPIVLLRKRDGSPLSSLVAPGNQYVGVMLPYTPLHYLLFASAAGGPAAPLQLLVMTSGNYSDEPIVKDNEVALQRLAPLADAFLLHDRDIHVHCDDSVIRVFEGQELPVRRSRGYAPFPVRLPVSTKPTLAVGGELKATFCLTQDDYAFMSQHIGDMENLETLDAFGRAVVHFQQLFRIQPELLVCDMHPAYLSSRWAREQANGRQLVTVQHHHAHIAALLAEHRLPPDEPVIGFSFDGTGYGDDGAIWGGEVLIADCRQYNRVAHLAYVPLPGGDAAIKRPYRTALAHLYAAGTDWEPLLPPVAACPLNEQAVVRRMVETGFQCVPTSSMGRLFDAVAALAGVRQTVTYEAQAAIEMEALAGNGEDPVYAFDMDETTTPLRFHAAPLIRAIARDVLDGVAEPAIAARFHSSVAALIEDLAVRLAKQHGIRRVALSGGVFQNVTLLQLAVARLRAHGFTVLFHHRVPPNDGGLALGQAIIAQFM